MRMRCRQYSLAMSHGSQSSRGSSNLSCLHFKMVSLDQLVVVRQKNAKQEPRYRTRISGQLGPLCSIVGQYIILLVALSHFVPLTLSSASSMPTADQRLEAVKVANWSLSGEGALLARRHRRCLCFDASSVGWCKLQCCFKRLHSRLPHKGQQWPACRRATNFQQGNQLNSSAGRRWRPGQTGRECI